jgi:hypothetical protein
MNREQRLDPVVHFLEVRGPADELANRLDAALADGVRYEQAMRPALAASVEQALTILKLLRPKTVVQAPRKWVTPLSLPRIDPA